MAGKKVALPPEPPDCNRCVHGRGDGCDAEHDDPGFGRRVIVISPKAKIHDPRGHIFRFYCCGKQFVRRPLAAEIEWDAHNYV
jgi:hypothetical protein